MKSKKQLKEDWNDLECVRDMFKSAMDNYSKARFDNLIYLIVSIIMCGVSIFLIINPWGYRL